MMAVGVAAPARRGFTVDHFETMPFDPDAAHLDGISTQTSTSFEQRMLEWVSELPEPVEEVPQPDDIDPSTRELLEEWLEENGDKPKAQWSILSETGPIELGEEIGREEYENRYQV